MSVFFLKTDIETRSRLPNNNKMSVLEIEVSALAVGGVISEQSLQKTVAESLEQKHNELEKRLRDAISKSNAGSSNNGSIQHQAFVTVTNDGSSNTVIIVAAVTTFVIFAIAVSLGCIAMAREEVDDDFVVVSSQPYTLKQKSTGATTSSSIGSQSQCDVESQCSGSIISLPYDEMLYAKSSAYRYSPKALQTP